MIYNQLLNKTNEWITSSNCTIKNIINYINKQQKLRKTQIDAIKIYLFLKIKGENKPLKQLFNEGFFINKNPKNILEESLYADDIAKFSLYKFAEENNIQDLKNNIDHIDYKKVIDDIFYNINYADYLMSLPMGAGKTYLMAAFIYLDLYFAINEPDNKNFAHNFLILIPSGLKNSITPSLKNIQNFDPTWILPKDIADNIKQQIKFDILDKPKSTKKSNQVKDPNVLKVNNILPNPFGQIFIVNAEKVILNTKTKNGIFTEEEIIENELKQKIAKIPNLNILIDEVHHAQKDEIKLRQVVNYWHNKGNITGVLGFSGTPYLSTKEKIYYQDDKFFNLTDISSIVYHYPLTNAIESFLKKPIVKTSNLVKTEIIKQAITDFNELYNGLIYENRTTPKCAIYCRNIKELEEVIYPFLINHLHINSDEILKYHGGNKEYLIPSENTTKFNSLDLPQSRIKYILLVQIGKEGWDCKSLTSVVLAGKKDSPKNMVLQTSCRCLREVDKNNNTALIYLNTDNAKILDSELKKQQQTSIEAINNLQHKTSDMIKIIDRSNYLKLPKVQFYQLQINYTTINTENNPNTKNKLQNIIKNIEIFKSIGKTTTGNLENREQQNSITEYVKGDKLLFNDFIYTLQKNSFNFLVFNDFNIYNKELKNIYNLITYNNYLNTLIDFTQILNSINLAFNIKRSVNNQIETIQQNAELVIAKNLKEVENNPKLYPNKEMIARILQLDKNPDDTFESDIEAQIVELTKLKKYDEIAKLARNTDKQTGLEIDNKNKTFHYIPYNFKQSNFEKEILQNILGNEEFNNKNLEIYYNGERHLTEFKILCYKKLSKSYKYIGKYTPDFLLIKRKNKEIHKVLIIETKGEGFANDPVFLDRKNFMQSEFIKQNNNAFGFDKFEFLYLEDNKTIAQNLATIQNTITIFFKE